MDKLTKSCFSLLALILLLAMGLGCSVQSKITRHLARAEKYFAAGEYDKARIEYFIVRKADPQNSFVLARLGRIYLSEGSMLQALSCLLPARQLAPNNSDVHCAWGEILL